MTIKYYTHFVLRERTPMSEFRGVIEVNRAVSRGDPKQAAAVLAKHLECESNNITILQWSRLH